MNLKHLCNEILGYWMRSECEKIRKNSMHVRDSRKFQIENYGVG